MTITKSTVTKGGKKTNQRMAHRAHFSKHLWLVASLSFASGMATAEQGIELNDSGAVVYFDDQGWSGNWSYLCVNDYCTSGDLVGERWQRKVAEITPVSGQNYTIQIKVQDNATGQFISPAYTVTAAGGDATPPPENLAPEISFDALASDLSTEDSLSVSVSASDSDGEVSSVSLYLTEPGSVELLYSTLNTEPYQWTIDPLVVGTYQLRAVASDNEQATTQAAESVYVSAASGGENQAPQVSIAAIGNKLEVGESVNVTASAIDTDGSIASVELFYREPNANEVSAGVLSSAPYQWQIGNLLEGSYSLRAVAEDNEGLSTDAEQSFVVTSNDIPPGTCEAPGGSDNPAADAGDGYQFGMTSDGLVYHRAIAGHTPGFAIVGLQNNAPNLPATGPFNFTENNGASYQRYETQIQGVDANTTYDLEIRLQGGQFNTGQCIYSIQVKPGQGVASSPCYIANNDSGGSETPVEPVKATIASVAFDADLGAYLKAGANTSQPGFSLYTFDNDSANQSSCEGECLVNWPALLVSSPDSFAPAGGVSGNFSTIERTRSDVDDCGNPVEVVEYQVTYNGEPLYFYIGDQSAEDTTGHGVFDVWWVADVELLPQLPLVQHPAPALKTAINGITPRRYGFAVDFDGRTVTWRPGYSPSQNGHAAGLIAQFSQVGGDGSIGAKDPNLEFYCSNNQIQFHKADMRGTLAGPYSAQVPGSCYGEYYYFFRYRMRGTFNLDPESNWVYSALFVYDETNPEDRIDPSKRETVTYRSANWMRHGHPHSRDRTQEFITFDAMPYNTSLMSGLERYNTTFIDGPGNTQIQTEASVAPIRLEIFEYGQGNCQGPQYVIGAENAPYPIRSEYNYGQILSWEASFPTANNSKFGGTSISSQVYNTMQHITIGAGFETATGDPRLNPAGRGSVRIVHSDGCNPVEQDERNARFAQQLTSVESDVQVNDFLLGHDQFHGMAQVSQAKPGSTGFAGSKAIVDVNGVQRKAENEGSCGDCHFRDGRSDFVVNTAKGPLLAPPTYGAGLLSYIEGAEVGLTWDGSQPTVELQAEAALLADLGLTPADIGETNFERIVTYTETLHVPVRKYDAYVDPAVADGEVAFHEVGCASCHQATQKTRSDAPVGLRDMYIRPYTDMKLWNVNGGEFRTAPLWAIGQNIEMLERNGKNTLFMHDGSATSLEQAIQLHDGDASATTAAFNALSAEQQASIIKFLKTL
ncbi:di-heme oxidoredictase family protein [Agarivorans aestuarii]|uniref:Di-heme oxidoredictase family protein n=1 Tax=Agarivorans aestuarii TaxID=1563703 RepID=A0ABU7G3J7_9ALTE|nr:di-heme oxidoredictase family protein [Agarivorans aestuarii]MEE1673060.1 di-heme oxidoredictase family protein [Agarivorans aestuarii]